MRRLLAWFRSLFRRPQTLPPMRWKRVLSRQQALLCNLFPWGYSLDFTDPTPRQHQPFRHRKPRQRATFRYRRLPNYRSLSRALETALRDALVPSLTTASSTRAVPLDATDEAYALSLYGDA